MVIIHYQYSRTCPSVFIYPVCFWEIDLFIKDDDEPSEQNHQLTLNQAIDNYKTWSVH
ncbi:CPCC family cysteine-rich protein [Clostridiaceae bacterium M8S5]|nr:CPCC family cysteine-rich protein [Clostridiaceae bacterium M8S5]